MKIIDKSKQEKKGGYFAVAAEIKAAINIEIVKSTDGTIDISMLQEWPTGYIEQAALDMGLDVEQ